MGLSQLHRIPDASWGSPRASAYALGGQAVQTLGMLLTPVTSGFTQIVLPVMWQTFFLVATLWAEATGPTEKTACRDDTSLSKQRGPIQKTWSSKQLANGSHMHELLINSTRCAAMK